MESQTPDGEFISIEVLMESLRRHSGKANVEIVDDIDVSPATRRVEGFTSTVLRVRVVYKVEGKTVVQNKSFVVKRPPQSDVRLQVVKEGGLFEREVFFLDKALSFMKTIGGRRMKPPVPDCYYAVSGSEDLIVAEDLTEIGYRTPDQHFALSGLDLEHCMLTMRRLGQLHGFSLAAERTLTKRSGGWVGMEPKLKEDLLFYEVSPEGVGDRPPSHAYAMLRGSMQTALDLAEEVNQRVGDAAASGELAKALEGAWTTVCQLAKAVPNGPNVLCHGDCWTNNVMYRYEKVGQTEKLVDAKFVDFQLSRYAHPCLDIVYFLHLSTKRAFRKKYTNELLLAYYNSLVDTLTFLGKGSPPITLGELRQEITFKYKAFGIIVASVLKPILTLDPKYTVDNVEDFTEERFVGFTQGNYPLIKECYENVPAYKENLIEILDELFELLLPNCY